MTRSGFAADLAGVSLGCTGPKEATFDGFANDAGSAVNAEKSAEFFLVLLDGPVGDAELIGDLFSVEPIAHADEDLALFIGNGLRSADRLVLEADRKLNYF